MFSLIKGCKGGGEEKNKTRQAPLLVRFFFPVHCPRLTSCKFNSRLVWFAVFHGSVSLMINVLLNSAAVFGTLFVFFKQTCFSMTGKNQKCVCVYVCVRF